MLKKDCIEIVGGLSSPGKMPGFAFGIPAAKCKRGSGLSKLENSVCSKCYAKKGRYVFPVVESVRNTRLEKTKNPEWVNAMVELLKDQKWFRWFDSGDIQDVGMLERIVDVCERTPECKHWLATREFTVVKRFIQKYNRTFPENLNIRISADFVGKPPAKQSIIDGCTNSTVNYKFGEAETNNCPATHHETIKTCDGHNCRKCWDKNIKMVNYKNH